jgi:hypothetical protein
MKAMKMLREGGKRREGHRRAARKMQMSRWGKNGDWGRNEEQMVSNQVQTWKWGGGGKSHLHDLQHAEGKLPSPLLFCTIRIPITTVTKCGFTVFEPFL